MIAILGKKNKKLDALAMGRGGEYATELWSIEDFSSIFNQMKKDLKDLGKRERLWYKKVNQKEKAHTCSENQKLTRKKCTKQEQSKRKSSYMQQES